MWYADLSLGPISPVAAPMLQCSNAFCTQLHPAPQSAAKTNGAAATAALGSSSTEAELANLPTVGS